MNNENNKYKSPTYISYEMTKDVIKLVKFFNIVKEKRHIDTIEITDKNMDILINIVVNYYNTKNEYGKSLLKYQIEGILNILSQCCHTKFKFEDVVNV